MRDCLIAVKCAALALVSTNLWTGFAKSDPVDMVYPYLDTENSRWFFFSSACRPFGLVNLSPDTEVDGAWGSGYRYKIENVKGFSHIHAWQLAGVSVMPITWEGDLQPILADHSSDFSHEEEIVKPGYHFLTLDRYGIDVELSSSKRAGFHRYRFRQGDRRGLLFSLMGRLGPSDMIDGRIEQLGPRTLRGRVVNAPTIRRPKPTTVFFYAAFDADVSEAALIRDKDGHVEKAVFMFDDEELDSAQMKIGISYTSEEGARRNLEAEIHHWDFDRLASESRAEWNDLLGRIDVEGNTNDQRRRFYTDLWHALQGRRLISDIDGLYPDNTGDEFRIGRIPLGNDGNPLFGHYNSDSFWGAQWTLNSLWHLVYPEITEEFVNSLLLYYKDGGLLPRGPSGGNYTYVMTGATSTPFIVSAWMKGIRGFDARLAFEAMVKNHMPGGIMGKAGYEHDTHFGGGLEHYIENGYVPYPIPEGDFGFHQDGASLTLEYAYQDWTLAQFAKGLGFESEAETFLKRSRHYRNVYDSETGWMRPKNINGKWKDPFDPYQYENGFNESNAAQQTWFVPHDTRGLAELMGGKEIAIDRLNRQFEQASELGFTSGDSHARETDPELRRIPINYGNQPSIQTAFLFGEWGRPDLSQFWSRKVVAEVYGGLNPGTGYNGDEDQGLMGSLAVLMKIGLFQVNGGTDADAEYQIGSPIFDTVRIRLNERYYSGELIEIVANNNSDENLYLESASWNGSPLDEVFISHRGLVSGGLLELDMTSGLGGATDDT